MFQKLIPYDAAHIILSAYSSYFRQFKRITKRAKLRFEDKDWHGIQKDAVERQSLYKIAIGNCTTELIDFLKDKATDKNTWLKIKEMYADEITNFNTRNIAETFYNSVFRHTHKGLSVNEELMFVHATGSYQDFKSRIPIYNIFDFTTDVPAAIKRIISFYRFDEPFEDLERDLDYLTRTFEERLAQLKVHSRYVQIEVLKPLFFRNKAAYLVGRMKIHGSTLPFVIPILNRENGIFFDALLLEYKEVSSIFSYYRSYFFVDIDIISELVSFLQTIMPTKELGELYSTIGFEKHGKTIFYRDFQRHLIRSEDEFVIAPGIKGMVMSVFTLPSYNMVFKLIKDRFDPPKKMTEKQVKEKYKLVSQHDRVGRMIDSHEFLNLEFIKNRFSDELLEELQQVAPSKVEIHDDIVKIKHLYIEKRMKPLNLYLETATTKERHHIINEYGRAVKEIASVNIFPGDLLLKNFGVTRLNRVVFYDYDEIGYLTDYNFREIPEARDDYEEFSREPFFHVSPNDIFPEEFARFIISDREVLKIFTELHGDLFGIKFWRDMQKRLREGEIVDIYPYRTSLRFVNKFGL